MAFDELVTSYVDINEKGEIVINSKEFKAWLSKQQDDLEF